MKKILIVEDEPILYAKLERLLKTDYDLYPFTPSVEDAIKHIDANRPDLVLLDIDLEGELSGLDLGKKLKDHYQIPFIYVTNHKDLPTFTEALVTGHDQYIVKTKPTLNKQELLHAIQTLLYKGIERQAVPNLIGLEVTEDYKDNLQKLQNEHSKKRTLIRFGNIAFLTNKETPEENTRKGYTKLLTIQKDAYYHHAYLNNTFSKLPSSDFLRINDHEIINLNLLCGRINGQNIEIEIPFDGTRAPEVMKLSIGSTYMKEVRGRLDGLFGK